jgi:hypothetical protein
MFYRYLLFVSLIFVIPAFGQTTLYQETFPSGTPQLEWMSGDGFSQLALSAAFPNNPSGDNTVGFVEGVADFGGSGQIISGSPSLSDYRIEAQIYVARSASAGSGTNNGILGRFLPVGDSSFSAYVLNTDFDSNNRLRLRKFNGAAPLGTPPSVIRDWTSAEIPGGIPAADGWHKLALEFNGDQINAYYDDQLLPGSPFTDTLSDSGHFGIYCFVGFETAADSATFFDDVVVTGDPISSVADNPDLQPAHFRLLQNYPNPFNPSTTIPFVLNESAEIRIEVVNLGGQLVATLSEGRWPAGEHRINWNAAGFPSGVYLVRLQSNNQSSVKRMIFLK